MVDIAKTSCFQDQISRIKYMKHRSRDNIMKCHYSRIFVYVNENNHNSNIIHSINY